MHPIFPDYDGDLSQQAIVLSEIKRAGLEPDYTYEGQAYEFVIGAKLPAHTLHRAPNQWVFTGQLPISIANEIYANEALRPYLQTGGGGDPQKEGVWRTHDGTPMFPLSHRKNLKRLYQGLSSRVDVDKEFAFVWKPLFPLFGTHVVEGYKISSLDALVFFVGVLRKHGLV